MLKNPFGQDLAREGVGSVLRLPVKGLRPSTLLFFITLLEAVRNSISTPPPESVGITSPPSGGDAPEKFRMVPRTQRHPYAKLQRPSYPEGRGLWLGPAKSHHALPYIYTTLAWWAIPQRATA